ncbi:conjugal transfer protein TraG N-terminal domain-containing protein [Actinobacillus delphinicola]|uniref:TraG-like protein, N-terminal region n=1 Tax=Actinobacillus delphinicola TaxID=51161 RepID=A0A448TTX3_9PAST|nr:conjugal transfer protein TraG N-terminal domain-containing protein [Actinobacillus delphinicola]VEJ09396.1 TraG-like protein, N-terminal region [Actinobacillus delphinicola]
MNLMTIRLEVDTYYEYFMNTFSWVMFDNTWELFKNTGLFILPIIIQILAKWAKVREEGADEGNKGKLLVNWLENYLYITITLMVMTCIPLFQVNFHIIDTKLDAMCGAQRTTPSPQETQLGQAFHETKLNGKAPEMPLWWAFVYGVSKGFTNGLVNAIPCRPHLEELSMALNQFTLSDPMLREDIAEFNNYCYIPAKNRFLKQMRNDGVTLNNAEVADIAWPGSKILLEGGFYGKYHVKYPKKYWKYLKYRDWGFGSDPAAGGFPMCDDFWKGNGVIIGGEGKKRSLYYRILDAYPEDLKQQVSALFKYKKIPGESYNDYLVRYAMSPQKLQMSDGVNPYGARYSGHYSEAGQAGSGWSFGNWGKSIISGISTFFGALGATVTDNMMQPTFKILKFSLQIIQPLLLALLTIATPIIIILSGYKPKAIINISFAFFGLIFLTYIWEVVHWIESWLFDALYDSSTYTTMNDPLNGLNNHSADNVFNLVIGIMYVVFPGAFFAMLGWAGINIGDFVQKAIDKQNSQAEKSGRKGANMGLAGVDAATGGKSKVITKHLRQ